MARRPARKADEPRILQLKIALFETEVWRSVQVSSAATLYELHRIIQIAMGWDNDHLHEFKKDKVVLEDEDVAIGQLLARKRSRLDYLYDFGDSWQHEVRVEEVLTPEPGALYPRCVAGARACPPEDCGGIGGYYDLLDEVEEDGEDGEGEIDFDPELFDLAQVNRQLRPSMAFARH